MYGAQNVCEGVPEQYADIHRRLTGLLRQIAPGAMWATAGAATHWLFSQSYSYIVAMTLDVTAVAAIAGIDTGPSTNLAAGLRHRDPRIQLIARRAQHFQQEREIVARVLADGRRTGHDPADGQPERPALAVHVAAAEVTLRELRL